MLLHRLKSFKISAKNNTIIILILWMRLREKQSCSRPDSC